MKPYLENKGKNLAVNYTDFSQYPFNIEERIILFVNLKNENIIQEYFKDSDYYRDSMNSKNDLEKNVFINGLKMQSNMQIIQDLLGHFFVDNEESLNDIYSLIIKFTDIMDQAKKYYNSLKLVYNFWTTFYFILKKKRMN